MSLSSSDSSSESVSIVLLAVGGAGDGWEAISSSTESSDSLLELTLLMSEYDSSKLSFLLRFAAKRKSTSHMNSNNEKVKIHINLLNGFLLQNTMYIPYGTKFRQDKILANCLIFTLIFDKSCFNFKKLMKGQSICHIH